DRDDLVAVPAEHDGDRVAQFGLFLGQQDRAWGTHAQPPPVGDRPRGGGVIRDVLVNYTEGEGGPQSFPPLPRPPDRYNHACRRPRPDHRHVTHAMTPPDPTATPASLGLRMPAEWEPHAATWLAWPHKRSDWPGKFSPIPWVYAEIVRALSR